MIWLPPSEGKTAPTSGPLLDLNRLVHPELLGTRRRIVRELSAFSADPDAARVLGLGPENRANLTTNLALDTSPCAASRRVFTGVLFEAADLEGLTARESMLAREHVRIFSGLFGVLGIEDPIPDHRLPMGARLPGIGSLAPFWRSQLSPALENDTGDDVVIDLRSGSYRSACPAPWASLLRVRVVREAAGRRMTISHDAKHWRGLVCARLLRRGSLAGDTEDALSTLEQMVGALEVHDARGVAHHLRALEVTDAGTRSPRAHDVVLVTD